MNRTKSIVSFLASVVLKLGEIFIPIVHQFHSPLLITITSGDGLSDNSLTTRYDKLKRGRHLVKENSIWKKKCSTMSNMRKKYHEQTRLSLFSQQKLKRNFFFLVKANQVALSSVVHAPTKVGDRITFLILNFRFR